jgi:steroid 5-alpha reductase family enzyme
VYFVLYYSIAGITPRFLLIGGLVFLWGIRLSLHIYLRHRGQSEDYRYRTLREKWGKSVIVRSFFQIFLLQSLLLVVTFSPVILLATAPPTTLTWLDIPFVIGWCIGFFFETVGDYQLQQFRAQRKKTGTIFTTGLWRYSRHPNYFGETVQWWSIFLIALAGNAPVATIIGPLMITILLLKISGITLLERKYHGNPDYKAYCQRTSAFIPWPQKRVV